MYGRPTFSCSIRSSSALNSSRERPDAGTTSAVRSGPSHSHQGFFAPAAKPDATTNAVVPKMNSRLFQHFPPRSKSSVRLEQLQHPAVQFMSRKSSYWTSLRPLSRMPNAPHDQLRQTVDQTRLNRQLAGGNVQNGRSDPVRVHHASVVFLPPTSFRRRSRTRSRRPPAASRRRTGSRRPSSYRSPCRAVKDRLPGAITRSLEIGRKLDFQPPLLRSAARMSSRYPPTISLFARRSGPRKRRAAGVRA